jgi:hypothetical protein
MFFPVYCEVELLPLTSSRARKREKGASQSVQNLESVFRSSQRTVTLQEPDDGADLALKVTVLDLLRVSVPLWFNIFLAKHTTETQRHREIRSQTDF